jgi:hypothetical protein
MARSAGGTGPPHPASHSTIVGRPASAKTSPDFGDFGTELPAGARRLVRWNAPAAPNAPKTDCCPTAGELMDRPTRQGASSASLECTFCAECAEDLDDRCPNCQGELMDRPTGQDAGKQPAT